jgi:23S rRNA (cytosine1962-C5)-methyltransferase
MEVEDMLNFIVLVEDLMLAPRLKKRFKHLQKWARRTGNPCFRVYEKDIPEFPLIVDWYNGDAVAWLMKRTRDDTPEAEEIHRQNAIQQILEGLELDPSQLFIKERHRQKGEEGRAQYEKNDQLNYVRVIEEQGLKFEVNLSDFLDTGLFLDHRIARSWLRDIASGYRILNLFAYTGSFSVYAMAGKAEKVTTVDMSNTYCDWTRRNMKLNGFKENEFNEIIATDCLAWLKQAKSEGRLYDIIICDPPTFSNSKRMEEASFSIDRDYPYLLHDCAKLLAPQGKIFFSNNSRSFKWHEDQCPKGMVSKEMTSTSVPEDFRNKNIHRSWWLNRE